MKEKQNKNSESQDKRKKDFEIMLKKFMKDSQRVQSEVRKRREAKLAKKR